MFMKRRVLYLDINTESESELLEAYKQAITVKEKTMTVTPNLDFFRIAYKNLEVRNVINAASFSTVDGKPVLWIAKWLKIKDLKYKISGSDLGMSVLKMMDENGFSIFLFGGKPGVAEKAIERINIDYPNVKIAGFLTPEMGYEKNRDLCLEYISQINAAKPDVVFLCTGSPKTEIFFEEYRDTFAPSCYFSLGATIDFIAGSIKRAPKWMSKIGLEWLYRLFSDFRRLFKRYWLDGWFLIKMWFICHFSRKAKKNEW